ncbi:hypothetical protein LA374_04460 [Aeromonas schubertii]|uniref:Lipase modulator n=1 Tax=Aeromonas schubertii TaxID=652 RepID=A0ABS7V7Z3_9GAMM|nr:hypothetical protein [Aeromonas schubertii]MBZ6065468.1 hypothetical protein [Aeromonas schubertii]
MSRRLLTLLLLLSLGTNGWLLMRPQAKQSAPPSSIEATPAPSCPPQQVASGRPSPPLRSEPAATQPEPPTAELEQAVSEWSQSSDGSLLLEKLYEAEQGSQLPRLFERLNLAQGIRPQVSDLLKELYRLGFDTPQQYEVRSQQIWQEIAALTGTEAREQLEQELYSGDPYRLMELQGRLAEHSTPLEPTQRHAMTRLMMEAHRHLNQSEPGDAASWLESQRVYTQEVLEQGHQLLNPTQYQVLREMLELELLRQEVSAQMERIYRSVEPQE